MKISFYRRKAVPVPVARMWVAICQVRRTHTPLQETHRGEAVQVRSLWEIVCQIWSFGVAHEEAPAQDSKMRTVLHTIEILFIITLNIPSILTYENDLNITIVIFYMDFFLKEHTSFQSRFAFRNLEAFPVYLDNYSIFTNGGTTVELFNNIQFLP